MRFIPADSTLGAPNLRNGRIHRISESQIASHPSPRFIAGRVKAAQIPANKSNKIVKSASRGATHHARPDGSVRRNCMRPLKVILWPLGQVSTALKRLIVEGSHAFQWGGAGLPTPR
jgi:hypothetical protein